MKRIAIIGGSGATGSEVLRLALEANHRVTLVVRNPDRVQRQEHLQLVAGDVTNRESLVAALQNVDAVISCFGPANGRKAGNLMSVGATNIVGACEQNGIKRFVFMSGILQSAGKELSLLNRIGIRLIRLFYKEAYAEKVIAERVIENSLLDWVIVRPVGLAKAAPQGSYKAGPHRRVLPFKPLAYADCAQCLLDAAKEKEWVRKIVNVGRE